MADLLCWARDTVRLPAQLVGVKDSEYGGLNPSFDDSESSETADSASNPNFAVQSPFGGKIVKYAFKSFGGDCEWAKGLAPKPGRR
jgi:hypothetical protein